MASEVVEGSHIHGRLGVPDVAERRWRRRSSVPVHHCRSTSLHWAL